MKKNKKIKQRALKYAVYFVLFTLTILFIIPVINLFRPETISIEPNEYLKVFIIILIGFIFTLFLNWYIKLTSKAF